MSSSDNSRPRMRLVNGSSPADWTHWLLFVDSGDNGRFAGTAVPAVAGGDTVVEQGTALSFAWEEPRASHLRHWSLELHAEET